MRILCIMSFWKNKKRNIYFGCNNKSKIYFRKRENKIKINNNFFTILIFAASIISIFFFFFNYFKNATQHWQNHILIMFLLVINAHASFTAFDNSQMQLYCLQLA